MTILLTDAGTFDVAARAPLWIAAADAERATGWQLKPQGMCRGDECVPLPASAVRGDSVDLAAFWQKLGAPIAHSDDNDAWSLGVSAAARNAALAGEVAPDFTLPDIDGRLITLSRLRGRKVFLATWASW